MAIFTRAVILAEITALQTVIPGAVISARITALQTVIQGAVISARITALVKIAILILIRPQIRLSRHFLL